VESAFGRSLDTGGRFFVGAFGRNLASVAVKMFSHLIYFIKSTNVLRFQVLTAVSMKITVFWESTPP
jgi:hypothetical protein